MGNVTYFADGLHIDFRIWPVVLVQWIAQAATLPPGVAAGYAVLLDKDHITESLPTPRRRAFIPARPSGEAYQTWIEEFFIENSTHE